MPRYQQVPPARPDDACFNLGSWVVLGLALLIVALSLAQSLIRLALPSEGWSFVRDLTGIHPPLIFERSITGWPSPIQPGDVLVAVEGQPIDEMLAGALGGQPRRPPSWQAGHTARYTIVRNGRELALDVPLVRLPDGAIVREVARNYLSHPGLLPALLISFFVFLRCPRAPAARLLFLVCACFFASEGISQIVGDSNVFGPAVLFERGVYWPAQFFNSLIWPFVIAPLFINLFLILPEVRWSAPLRTRRGLATIYGILPVLTLITLALSRGRTIDFWRAWASLSTIDYFATLIGVVLIMAYTIITVRDPAGRAQIRWVAWGAVVTCAGAILGGVLTILGRIGAYPLLDFLIFRLPILAFPIALAIAITRYRLFDIDIIINRTLVYGALTGVLALVYGGSVMLLQALFETLTGEGRDELVTVVSTLLIAALFSPLRRRIQAAIDRRFYRRTYDAARTLAAFNITIRDEVDLNQLAGDLLEVVEEAMQPTFVSLWLCNASGCLQAIDSTARWSDPAEAAEPTGVHRFIRPMQREVSEVERSLAGTASHPAFRS